MGTSLLLASPVVNSKQHKLCRFRRYFHLWQMSKKTQTPLFHSLRLCSRVSYLCFNASYDLSPWNLAQTELQTTWTTLHFSSPGSHECRAAMTDSYPSSVIPSINSFLENSHWVAARNFHATTSTVMLVGSSERSSQNCWIPSMPILFSSWGSTGQKNPTTWSTVR